MRRKVLDARLLGAVGVALIMATVLVAVVRAPSISSASVDISDGSAWLPNQNAGGAFLVNGITADIVWTLPVAEPGADLTVVQQPRGALVLDRSAGVLSRIDNVSLQVSARYPVPAVDEVALASNDSAVYVLDSNAGRVRQLDAETLSPLGETPVSGDLRGVVDDDGRLWALDRSTGRVHLIEDGQVADTVDVFPGGDETDIVLAGGRPLVVDASRAEIALLDPSGERADRLTLSTSGPLLAAGGQGGAGTASILAPEAGALITCGTAEPSCRARSLDPVARAGQQFGRPEAHRGVVYIPNLSTGEVVVVDAADAQVPVRVVPALRTVSDGLEVFAKDDLVWFNNRRGSEAGVLNRDGVARRVEKYAAGMSDADVRALVLRSQGDAVDGGPGTGGRGNGDAPGGGGPGAGAGPGDSGAGTGPDGSAGSAGGPDAGDPRKGSPADDVPPSQPDASGTEVAGITASRPEPIPPIALADANADDGTDARPPTPAGLRSSAGTTSSEPDRPAVISRPSGSGSGGSGSAPGPASAAPGAFAVEIQAQSAAARQGSPFGMQGAILAGQVASWRWDFGDGSTAEGQAVTKTWTTAGTFQVTLRARAESGAETQASQLIRVVAPDDLLASFSVSRSSVEVGGVVRFEDTSVGSVDRWRWDFGDRATASGRTVEHSWANAGTYQVTLVAGNAVREDRAATTVTVNATQPPPAAAFDVQGDLAVNKPVTFVDRSGNAPTGWSWTFGDGGTASGSVVSHSFTRPGDFTVTLVATNAAGQGAPAERIVHIVDQPRPPTSVKVSITGSTDTTLDVAWDYDNPSGATLGATVLWTTAAGPQRVELDPTARGTRIVGLAAETTYPVEVVIGLPNGGASTSGSASGTTKPPEPPPPPPPPPPPAARPPTNVTLEVTATTTGTISVGWSYDNPDSATYVATLSWGVGGNLASQAQVDPAARAHTITGLAAGTTYDVRIVVGLADNGPSTLSPAVSATTKLPPLATPTNVSASGGQRSIQVTWAFDNNGAAARLTVSWANSSGSTRVDLDPSATSYTIGGLPSDTTFEVRVAAEGRDGTGTASPVVTATTAPAAKLATPAITSASGGEGSIAVAWTFDDNGAAARLVVSWGNATTPTQQHVLVPSATGYTITGLPPGTTFEVRVAAEGYEGTSTGSPWVSATTNAATTTTSTTTTSTTDPTPTTSDPTTTSRATLTTV